MEVGAGRRSGRGDDGRVRWVAAGGRKGQHVFVVVGEGRDEVGVAACWALVCGRRSQLAIECARSFVGVRKMSRLGLQLQLALGTRAIYKVQATAKAVHALADVVQGHRKPEWAVGPNVDGGRAEQREPVSLFGLFGGR